MIAASMFLSLRKKIEMSRPESPMPRTSEHYVDDNKCGNKFDFILKQSFLLAQGWKMRFLLGHFTSEFSRCCCRFIDLYKK